MILAGDIGGTSTRLDWADSLRGRPVLQAERVYKSRDYSALADIVAQFLKDAPGTVSSAAFGIAGPVLAGVTSTPNLPWVVRTTELAGQLGLKDVALLNDLKAHAYGLAHVAPENLVTLQKGEVPAGGANAALIAAGTGLGEAGLFWDGHAHQPFATESGHADFAPRNALESELLQYLLKQFERVSYERVLSGMGLPQLYNFLRDTGRGEESEACRAAMASGDPSAAITQAALERADPLANAALDAFVSLYGAEAGNLALRTLALGGVYVGGGIAPKILHRITSNPAFLESFLAKGRMRPLLERIPVRIVLDEKTALLGSAHCALLGLELPLKGAP